MSSFASTNHAAGGLLPAAGLVLVAPLVAEYLLGNMSITQLGMLAILAPLYMAAVRCSFARRFAGPIADGRPSSSSRSRTACSRKRS